MIVRPPYETWNSAFPPRHWRLPSRGDPAWHFMLCDDTMKRILMVSDTDAICDALYCRQRATQPYILYSCCVVSMQYTCLFTVHTYRHHFISMHITCVHTHVMCAQHTRNTYICATSTNLVLHMAYHTCTHMYACMWVCYAHIYIHTWTHIISMYYTTNTASWNQHHQHANGHTLYQCKSHTTTHHL